ncbi:sugar phosphate isomerase/epimerase family protein [Histidinibacterium aquaticum]|nr:TIM barrel protein [Histidinibacterium aquaticum]
MDVLDAAVGLKMPVLQYADNMRLHEIEIAKIDEIATSARERGVALEIGAQGFERDMVSRYVALADQMDASILRIALDGEDAARPLEDLGEDLRGAVAEARGICRIAIENHFDYPSPQMARLLDRVEDDGLGVCLDVANSICAGEWPAETVGLLAPRTINLHMKDYVIAPDPYGVGFRVHGVPLGEGRTDMAAVLDALEGRAMSVIYEHWLPWPGDFSAAHEQERVWTAQGTAALSDILAAR